MEESKGWELQRYVTLFVVLALHAGLLVVLVLASLAKPMPGMSAQTVELLLLAPPSFPLYAPKPPAQAPERCDYHTSGTART